MLVAMASSWAKAPALLCLRSLSMPTLVGDVAETEAVKDVFGEHAPKVAMSSTKGAIGHMLGAAGAVEMAICSMALAKDVVPPTINLDNPDPECDLDYVPHTPREMKV